VVGGGACSEASPLPLPGRELPTKERSSLSSLVQEARPSVSGNGGPPRRSRPGVLARWPFAREQRTPCSGLQLILVAALGQALHLPPWLERRPASRCLLRLTHSCTPRVPPYAVRFAPQFEAKPKGRASELPGAHFFTEACRRGVSKRSYPASCMDQFTQGRGRCEHGQLWRPCPSSERNFSRARKRSSKGWVFLDSRVLNNTTRRVTLPPPPSGMRGGTGEGRSEHQEAEAREPYDASSPRRTRMHLLAALSRWILELAFRVHALGFPPPADRVVVPPVHLLVGGFAVKLRYGGPHARHLQALPAPATIPV
jgi:hypothetical protein